jgi:hypothetical protein
MDTRSGEGGREEGKAHKTRSTRQRHRDRHNVLLPRAFRTWCAQLPRLSSTSTTTARRAGMSQHPDDALAEALDGLRKDWAPGSRSGDLFSGESFWRDHQPWLLERGYQLRARYQPNWKPSWKASGRSKQACEDSYPPKVRRYVALEHY